MIVVVRRVVRVVGVLGGILLEVEDNVRLVYIVRNSDTRYYRDVCVACDTQL
jgi:hypothetical protein